MAKAAGPKAPEHIPPTPAYNGRKPSLEPPVEAHVRKMLLPLSRKISWAIATTYLDIVGERLPRGFVDTTADGIASTFLDDLQVYFELRASPASPPTAKR